MNNGNFKDIRLIEAFDYIDPKYIAEVGESLKLRSVQDKEYVKPTFGKHVKQIALLVGCLLLLSCAFPAFNYFLEVVNSMAAGWGSWTETAGTAETTNGMYDEYILTEEDLAKLNEAYFRSFISASPELYAGWDEESLNEMRESKYCKFAETIERAMHRPTERPANGGYCYIGKYGDCIVYITMGNSFSIYPDRLIVCYGIDFYSLETACENSWISDEELERIHEFCRTFDYYNGG